jgi:hypothetical protein
VEVAGLASKFAQNLGLDLSNINFGNLLTQAIDVTVADRESIPFIRSAIWPYLQRASLIEVEKVYE